MPSRPVDRERAASPAEPRPPVALRVGRVGVVFTWACDRWRHTVSVDGRPLAVSLEHTADGRHPAWPASPPLVDLSTATAAAGAVILAVGRAGRNHYSASVAPHPAEPDTVVLEIACRISQQPDWLGSTYEIAGRTMRIAAPPHGEVPATVRWAYTAGPAGLRPLPPAEIVGGR